MSMGELFFIGVVILLVVPPEKLPGLAREVARLLNEIRRSTSGVWEELKKDVPNPMADLRKEKQEVDEYLKFIGSGADHAKDHANNPHFVSSADMAPPVLPPEVKTAEEPKSEEPKTVTSSGPAFSNKPTFVITPLVTPSAATAQTAEQKNESDPTKK